MLAARRRTPTARSSCSTARPSASSPAADGTVRSLPALFLYTGASTESGTLEARPAVLTAPEITTYDSAILFQPLELAVEREVGVGVLQPHRHERKGLLGSNSTRSMVLPGEVGAEPRAGGSHGGAGWFGSAAGGWNRTDLAQPGSVFDSLRDPHLPGGGGASPDANAGGAGGGVDAAARPGSAGAHRRRAGRRRRQRHRRQSRWRCRRRRPPHRGAPRGERLSSPLAAAPAASTTTPVAVAAVASRSLTAAEVDLRPRHPARRQRWHRRWRRCRRRADRRGGAGTMYLEQVDAESGVAAPGSLRLANPIDPVRAALTPLPALGDGDVWSIDPATGVVVLDVARVRGEVLGDQLVLGAEDGTALGSLPHRRPAAGRRCRGPGRLPRRARRWRRRRRTSMPPPASSRSAMPSPSTASRACKASRPRRPYAWSPTTTCCSAPKAAGAQRSLVPRPPARLARPAARRGAGGGPHHATVARRRHAGQQHRGAAGR